MFSGMAERRMAEIMRQGHGLGQVLINPQDPRNRPGDLRDLDRVGQARTVIIALVINEDLGLILQLAERAGMNDPVAVALKDAPGQAFGFGIKATARPRRIGRKERPPLSGDSWRGH